MSLRPILKWPDQRLSETCIPVDAINADVRALCSDLLDAMYDAPGRGLAAPQVGDMRRVFVMDPDWKDGVRDPLVCINPEILAFGADIAEGPEMCLSIPGLSVLVRRPTSIRLAWTDLEGQRQERGLTGFAALCAQHEFDHLEGIVTLDRVDRRQRARLLAEYEAA